MSIITNTVRDVNDTFSEIVLEFSPLEVLKENIPKELKAHRYWAVWKATPRPNGGFNKIPCDADGNYLKTNYPENWLSYAQVIAAYETGDWDGIGFLSTPSDFLGAIDIDHCTDRDSPNFNAAQDIMNTLNTYSEFSPSGTGVHCVGLVRKGLKLEGNKSNGLEFYTENRFLTVTGNVIGGQTSINKLCHTNFMELHKKYVVDGKKQLPDKMDRTPQISSGNIIDFPRDTSPSGYDFAICRRQIEQGRSDDEIREYLLEHGQNQDKYQRPDYLDRTISNAREKVNPDETAEIYPMDWRQLPSINHRAVMNQEFVEPEWLIQPWIQMDTFVGQIVGEQQTGKSFLLSVLSYSIAAGKSFDPFNIPKPRRVLYLNMEDSKNQIERRCKTILDEMAFTVKEMSLIEENLMILPWLGRFGALMNSNSESTENFRTLKQAIADFRPDLVICDTKSRLSAGEENSNDVQAALVRLLEELVVENNCVLLMAHHPNKSNPTSSRGGGAWESNIRLTINLTKMPPAEGKIFNLSADATSRCYKMISSDNYGGKNEAFFMKDAETGFPRPIFKQESTSKAVEDWLYEALKEHAPVNRRLLVQNRPGNDTKVSAMMESFPQINGEKKQAIAEAIDKLIEADRIYDIKDGKTNMLTTQKPTANIGKRSKATRDGAE